MSDSSIARHLGIPDNIAGESRPPSFSPPEIYFVSYTWQGRDGTHFGNTAVSVPTFITSYDTIREMQEALTERMGDRVTILGFTHLRTWQAPSTVLPPLPG